MMRRAILVTTLLVLGACSNEARQLTGPSLSNPRLDVETEGTPANVCVSDDSPAGNYTFTVSNIAYPAGGFTVAGTNPAVVARGACFSLATRLIAADELHPEADPVTTITYSYTSNDVSGGAGYSGTTCDDDPGIPASDPCGATVIAHVNIVAGTKATFSFVSAAQLIESVRAILSDLDIPKGTGPKLDDNLGNALKALGKGQTSRACKELDQFVKEVEHLTKKIGSTDTATILAKASEVQVALGCR